MATNDTGGQRQAPRRTEETEQEQSASTEEVKERHEENAEEFVRSYVQKGGQ
jgi:ubiquitin-like protein Pup